LSTLAGRLRRRGGGLNAAHLGFGFKAYPVKLRQMQRKFRHESMLLKNSAISLVTVGVSRPRLTQESHNEAQGLLHAARAEN
jgi:hypothetical protein